MAPKSQHALRTPERGHGVSIPVQRGQELPAQRGPLEDDGFPISVTSLLRREGMRAPHAVDGPLQPRAHHVQAAGQPGSWIDGVIIRRAGAAAGALVAAASVLGAAVLTDASGGGLIPQVTIPNAPGDGRVDTLPGLALLGPMTPGTAGVVSLAAFQPASGGVLPGGLPGIVPGVPGGLPVLSGGGNGPGTQILGTVTSPVEDLTNTVGGLLPAPVGGVVAGLGGVVDGAGGAVDGLVDGVAGPLAGPVGSVTAPVTGAAQNVTGAVGDTVDKVAEPVGKATKPVTDTVGKVAGPVVSLIDGDDERRDPALSTIGSGEQGGSLLGSVGRTAAGLLGGG